MQLTEENKRLNNEANQAKDYNDTLARMTQDLQLKLQEKEEELTLTTQDKVRFKELSEGYMQEVARLEAQLEAADLKPKSKLSYRPKDTVVRDNTNSISNS